ncbi:MAG: radical SAM protein [Pyrobaculum sp.]
MESLEKKQRVIKLLEEKLSQDERREARRDSHAKRQPRPCGITVHTGLGCPLGCVYCYIYDMGFSGSIKPYRLTPLQLTYALAINPHVSVGEWGTLVAVGSVTEPFLKETRELAVRYIDAISTYLKNSVQVSTKVGPPPELQQLERKPDVLISVTDVSGRLEPRAPPPIQRLEAGALYIKNGGNSTLFIRPVVPDVTEREIERLLKIAGDLGYRRVVFGTLRVTVNIAKRLNAFGINVLPYVKKLGRSQTPIHYPKTRLLNVARDMGFDVLPASCASNILTHDQSCALCSWGPCGDVKKLKIDVGDIERYLETRGYRGVEVEVKRLRVVIRGRITRVDKIFLEQSLRVRLVTAR